NWTPIPLICGSPCGELLWQPWPMKTGVTSRPTWLSWRLFWLWRWEVPEATPPCSAVQK
ncbi:hypothetical protein GOODEAATRI_015077, partial [Goodea atripinnis]